MQQYCWRALTLHWYKKICLAPEGNRVISEDDSVATSQLQLQDSQGMEDSELAGETSSFSPYFPLPSPFKSTFKMPRGRSFLQ